MKRRAFLKFAALAVVLDPVELLAAVPRIRASKVKKHVLRFQDGSPENVADTSFVDGDGHIKDYLTKIRFPDISHQDDILLTSREFTVLQSVVARFKRIRATAGHGNFCVLGFQDAFQIAKKYPKVGKFSEQEMQFLEKIYYQDANSYGFRGKKQIVAMDLAINTKDVYKVPYSGNYLFRGESLAKYKKVKRELGEDLVLTSGIRGVAKQFYLYLNKAYRHGGNLSLASRSLAPPGYSYHAMGDFDVGQRGFGRGNFSEEFLATSVFKNLIRQGFVEYRYARDNMLGVRYEPWHIKL